MKKLNLLYRILFIVLWIDIVMVAECFSQEKTDNTAIVKGVSFNEVCQTIVDMNIPIKSRDDQTQSVVAEDPTVSYQGGLRLFVRVKDSVAYISARFYGYFDAPISFRGMKGSLMKDGAEYIKTFASKFHREISYCKL